MICIYIYKVQFFIYLFNKYVPTNPNVAPAIVCNGV